MFKILPESHDDLIAIKASGKLGVDDYEKVMIPRLNEMFEKYKTIRCMVIFDESFAGWADLHAAWDDAKLGLKHPNDFSKIALVGSPKWMDWGMAVFGLFVRGEFRFFPRDKQQEALEWIES